MKKTAQLRLLEKHKKHCTERLSHEWMQGEARLRLIAQLEGIENEILSITARG